MHSAADAHEKANAVVVSPVVDKPIIKVLDVGSSYNPYRLSPLFISNDRLGGLYFGVIFSCSFLLLTNL